MEFLFLPAWILWASSIIAASESLIAQEKPAVVRKDHYGDPLPKATFSGLQATFLSHETTLALT